MSDNPFKTPSGLHEMQIWMQNALLDPRCVEAGDLTQRLIPSNKMSASDRLGIYQRSYILRLCKCLAEQFPAVCRALGATLFDQFAREYLAQMPSESHTLYDLGERFAVYLEATRPDRDLPDHKQELWINFMMDLVTYERQLFVMFDAYGHEGKPWPDVRAPDQDLVLQPCFDLGQYRFPVAAYYHNVSDETAAVIPDQMDTYVALARQDYVTTTYPITKLHHQLLQAIQTTEYIDGALEQLAHDTGFALNVLRTSWQTEIRTIWINAGFFVHR